MHHVNIGREKVNIRNRGWPNLPLFEKKLDHKNKSDHSLHEMQLKNAVCYDNALSQLSSYARVVNQLEKTELLNILYWKDLKNKIWKWGESNLDYKWKKG